MFSNRTWQWQWLHQATCAVEYCTVQTMPIQSAHPGNMETFGRTSDCYRPTTLSKSNILIVNWWTWQWKKVVWGFKRKNSPLAWQLALALLLQRTLLNVGHHLPEPTITCHGSAVHQVRARSLTPLSVDLNGRPVNKYDHLPFVQSLIKERHWISASWVPGPQPA